MIGCTISLYNMLGQDWKPLSIHVVENWYEEFRDGEQD